MATAGRVGLEPVHAAASRGGGARVLVGRVWPRGVRRESLGFDLWLRELGPPDELRKCYRHRPAARCERSYISMGRSTAMR
jgi:uncharacterized protein YeaO (DUF488 family)